MTDDKPDKISKTQFLTLVMLARGDNPFIVQEAVASVALSHPDEDWDTPERTLAEWLEWREGEG